MQKFGLVSGMRWCLCAVVAFLLVGVLENVVQAGNVAELKARHAMFDGYGAKFGRMDGVEGVGYWDGQGTSVYWKVRVIDGGKVKVVVEQSCEEQFAGSEYTVWVGNQKIEAKTAGTLTWNTVREVEIGEVELKEGESFEVRVVPGRKKVGNVFMALSGLKFVGEEGDDVFVGILDDDAFYEQMDVAAEGYVEDGVKVVYPQGMKEGDADHSLIFVKQLRISGELKDRCKVKPILMTDGTRFRTEIALPRGANIYGGGEVTGDLERTGVETRFWNTDNFTYREDEGRRLYQSHPWLMVVREDGSAFGVIMDTTYRGKVETTEQMIRFEFDGEPYRVVILEGDGPAEVLEKLGMLTGRMNLPPKWALGFQQCRYSYYPQARVKQIADEFRKREIPCDVIWMDIDYMDGFKIFTFNPKTFTDPKGVNDYLHDKGFKGVWMIDPGVKQEEGYGIYESGTENDVWVRDYKGDVYTGDVWPGRCVFPDFTRPDVREWWAGLYKDFMANGIDGVWNDMNEPAVFTEVDHTMPMTNWHVGGGEIEAGDHRKYHNVYGMQMVRASREGLLKVNPKKRPFILSRSNFLGGQRYAATWTGDNQSTEAHMKMSVPMTLTMGLSGQPFNGPDLGGFDGFLNGELMAKWVGFGSLFPFARAHAAKGTNDKEFWVFGEEVEAVSRKALERRYRLLPYMYTVFEEASRTGLPVMRPVFMADVKDLRLRKEQQAFLLGKDVLVVPRFAEDAKLPKGIWRSVPLVGEDVQNEKYLADVKVRGGAILPIGRVVQNTMEESFEPLTLFVVLDENGEAEGTLYEDAGDGFGYQAGDYLRTTYKAKVKGGDIVVWVDSTEGKRERPAREVVVKVFNGDGVRKGRGVDGQEIWLSGRVKAAG